jgi:hypothetical protein
MHCIVHYGSACWLCYDSYFLGATSRTNIQNAILYAKIIEVAIIGIDKKRLSGRGINGKRKNKSIGTNWNANSLSARTSTPHESQLITRDFATTIFSHEMFFPQCGHFILQPLILLIASILAMLFADEKFN